MTELEKIFGEIQERLGLEVSFYRENARAHGGPVCEKPFDGITDDGNYTFFRFLYKNIGYVGALKGVGETQNNYALLLPPYIESFSDKEPISRKRSTFGAFCSENVPPRACINI